MALSEEDPVWSVSVAGFNFSPSDISRINLSRSSLFLPPLLSLFHPRGRFQWAMGGLFFGVSALGRRWTTPGKGQVRAALNHASVLRIVNRGLASAADKKR